MKTTPSKRELANGRVATGHTNRRGAIIVLVAVLIVAMFGFIAFSVDYGYMSIVRSELQNAADAAALSAASELSVTTPDVHAAAREVASANTAAGKPVSLDNWQITPGIFDLATKTFTPNDKTRNAVHIRTRVIDQPLFFAKAIGHDKFSLQAEATAMLNPRDIVLVVDLSGSMNDDVEPCWATQAIAARRSADGKSPDVAYDMVETLYDDLDFGDFPGDEEWVGEPLGVPTNHHAYAEMTDDFGPLTDSDLDDIYRISASDDETTRKYKAYAWIIDHQLKELLPDARPTPTSKAPASATYWEKYLDYILTDVRVGEPPPPTKTSPTTTTPSTPPPSGPKPPVGNVVPLTQPVASTTTTTTSSAYPGTPRNGSTAQSGYIPPSRDWDRIHHMNNPNRTTYSSADGSIPHSFANRISYRTYVQFMLDFGRNRSPDVGNGTNAATGVGIKTQLSVHSSECRYHKEKVGKKDFSFPPRTQPMHACRRSLIRAIQSIEARNDGIDPASADRVAVVTFDGNDAYHTPQVLVSFTTNYKAAMEACTELQAASDIGNTTGTELGLRIAREMLRSPANGGSARPFAKKVMVLLTDGVPNAWESPQSDVDAYVTANPSSNYYGASYLWYNAALMQGAKADAEGVESYAVGMGIGADYDFLDRLARLSNTDKAGQAPRTSGDPTAYEAQLTKILDEIIRTAGTRLVQ